MLAKLLSATHKSATHKEESHANGIAVLKGQVKKCKKVRSSLLYLFYVDAELKTTFFLRNIIQNKTKLLALHRFRKKNTLIIIMYLYMLAACQTKEEICSCRLGYHLERLSEAKFLVPDWGDSRLLLRAVVPAHLQQPR
jgi:hypothetical protein